jgi:hypothetical protein
VHPKDESENAKMQQSMDGGESDQLEEDVAMLRQILDNLGLFVFARRCNGTIQKNLNELSPSLIRT